MLRRRVRLCALLPFAGAATRHAHASLPDFIDDATDDATVAPWLRRAAQQARAAARYAMSLYVHNVLLCPSFTSMKVLYTWQHEQRR